MSLSSSDTDINKRQRKLQFTSKAVQEEILIDSAPAPPCENTLSITYLPDECLELIYQSITFGADHSSFGLVCRHWLQIQNNNHESLWDLDDSKCSLRKSPKTSPEIFSKILCKLLTRFQHLKRLSLSGLPEVTDYVTSQSQLFGSKVQRLCLKFSEYPDNNLSLIFSSFPCLTSVCLSSSHITDRGLEILANCCGSLEKVDLNNCRKVTDKGLESLAKTCVYLVEIDLGECQRITDKGLEGLANYCASLKKVDLRCCKKITDKGLEVLAKSCASLENVDLIDCQGITDSGISFLMQNCSKIHSLGVSYCDNVTGIGFVGCRKTLTHVDARFMRILTTEGIKAIVSGGGIQSLSLSGNAVNNEAVITISKGCSLLKSLQLKSCHEVQLEGWKAIGLYCRNLVDLHVAECRNLCDQGLKALCYGCNKLCYLFVDSWSDNALKLFQRERPDVLYPML
ncbi:hypothetical protein MKW92_020355 [Papaver armeniacum]|nr:hypothetical protein MKW92_020355 [Papaver armeniacum]